MTKKVVLDTDIGTDVDDVLALGVCLGSPELDLVGVTTVYGDVDLRARMVRKLLALRGVGGVPVVTGARAPLLGRRPVYWAGHEGEGLLDDDDADVADAGGAGSDDGPGPGGDPVGGPDADGADADGAGGPDAVEFLARTVRAHPGAVHLVAIGPLTTVALALLRHPELAGGLAGLTIMGGVLRGADGLHLPLAEHNIRSDAEAAHVVFGAGVPISLVPLDVTTRVSLWPATVDRLRSDGRPFHRAVAGLVDRDPRYRVRGHAFCHDPLAVASVVEPDLLTWHDVAVTIELNGEHTTGMTLLRAPKGPGAATVRVALGVDVERAEAFIVDRLTR